MDGKTSIAAFNQQNEPHRNQRKGKDKVKMASLSMELSNFATWSLKAILLKKHSQIETDSAGSCVSGTVIFGFSTTVFIIRIMIKLSIQTLLPPWRWKRNPRIRIQNMNKINWHKRRILTWKLRFNVVVAWGHHLHFNTSYRTQCCPHGHSVGHMSDFTSVWTASFITPLITITLQIHNLCLK